MPFVLIFFAGTIAWFIGTFALGIIVGITSSLLSNRLRQPRLRWFGPIFPSLTIPPLMFYLWYKLAPQLFVFFIYQLQIAALGILMCAIGAGLSTLLIQSFVAHKAKTQRGFSLI